jgi:hypothetical protein
VTAFLATAATLFQHNNLNASSEEEEEGVVLQPNSSSAKRITASISSKCWVRVNNHIMTARSPEVMRAIKKRVRSSAALRSIHLAVGTCLTINSQPVV